MSVRSLLLGALFASLVRGQGGAGELRLVVRDPAGAAIAASVELVSLAAQTRLEERLPSDGRYTFKNLPFGLYRMVVTSPGLDPTSQMVEVRTAVPQTREVLLALPGLKTAVEVTDTDNLIDPNRIGSASYIGPEEIRGRLSGLAGRGTVDLVALQPGWTFEANGILHPRESEYETQYIVDGFPVQENRSPAFAPNLEVEDIQSMKLYTSGIPAEYGQKVGGVIEVTTDRNASPGFHGQASLQAGSFDALSGYVSGQYTVGKTSASASAAGFFTNRYLDPTVEQNYSNHASSSSFRVALERDFSDANRLRLSASHQDVHFQVPNELLQEAAGQREDRTSDQSSGQVAFQHIFSPHIIGAVRGMVRDVSAQLWSNPLATPIAPWQDRGFREVYAGASLAGHSGRHEWMAGADLRYAPVRENFGFRITDYSVDGVPIFDPETPENFSYSGQALDREQSAFVQDQVRLGQFSLSVGLRFDHYSLLVDETAISPRLAASWSIQPWSLVLHASYDRTFGTPPFENLLVSSSPQARALSGSSVYLPLRPSQGNYYEAGLTKSLTKHIRLDANFFLRDIRNYQDDDLLENTGVSFPIAIARGKVRGFEAALHVPRWGRFSGFINYAHMLGVAQYPIAGGLFLEEDAAQLVASSERFPVSQDQRNIVRAVARYQITRKLWTSWRVIYNSGLPTELDDSQPYSFLVAQYGPAVVGSVNFDRGRVSPTFSLDASAGATVWERDSKTLTLQADVLNLTDRLNVINFAGFLSGTAIGTPRSFGLRLRAQF